MALQNQKKDGILVQAIVYLFVTRISQLKQRHCHATSHFRGARGQRKAKNGAYKVTFF